MIYGTLRIYLYLPSERTFKMTQDVESPVAGSKSKKKVVKTPMKHSKKLHKEKCLFLRYKHRKPPSREEVRLLHPNIIDVRFPRQKSSKY